jgi:hypothetical protein
MDAPAVKPIPAEAVSHTITQAEVMKWAEGSKKPWPDTACEEIAAGLTRMSWVSDPPLPVLKKGKHWERSVDFATEPPKIGEWQAKPDIDDGRWWDFQAATDATNILLASIPRMLRFFEGLQSFPKTSGGYPAIKAVEAALLAAQPYIESPFGKREGPPYRPSSNVWHMPAFVVAGIISKALVQSGQRAPKFARTSVATQVVHEALNGMGYPAVNESAIAMYLSRCLERGQDGFRYDLAKFK